MRVVIGEDEPLLREGLALLLSRNGFDVVSAVGDADPEVVSVMVGRSARDDGRVDRLTPRQLQVLGLLAEGRSNLAIANRLGITEKAVARHAAQLYDALGLPPNLDDHRRVLAVVRFLDR